MVETRTDARRELQSDRRAAPDRFVELVVWLVLGVLVSGRFWLVNMFFGFHANMLQEFYRVRRILSEPY
jgi:prolipoprotein diacylglyceryltransferase